MPRCDNGQHSAGGLRGPCQALIGFLPARTQSLYAPVLSAAQASGYTAWVTGVEPLRGKEVWGLIGNKGPAREGSALL